MVAVCLTLLASVARADPAPPAAPYWSVHLASFERRDQALAALQAVAGEPAARVEKRRRWLVRIGAWPERGPAGQAFARHRARFAEARVIQVENPVEWLLADGARAEPPAPGGAHAAAEVAAAPAGLVPVEPLHIEMDPGEADDLNDHDPKNEIEVPMAIVDGAQHLPGHLAVKGSFTRVLKKKGLLIKLDKPLQWQGESRIIVDARATDPTLMRDWMAYDLWRSLGMVGASARYLRVLINGQPRGPFLQVGWIGPDLFERAGLGRDGLFYTAPDKLHCGDFSMASLRTFTDCWARLQPAEGTDDAFRAMVRAIDAASDYSIHEVVDRYFDAESLLNWFVTNSVVANGDTYDKNYFLYQTRKTGKWHVVPFDFDLSHGRAYDPDLAYPKNVLNDAFMYWYPLEQGAANPLHRKALRNPILYERMRQRFAELMDDRPDPHKPWQGWMSAAAVERRIDALRETLLPLWAEDPLAAPQPVIEENVLALRHFYRMRRAYLRRTVVEGRAGRGRDVAEGPLPAVGHDADYTDEGGFVLASLTVRSQRPPTRRTVRSGTISVTVAHGAPRQLPPKVRAKDCVQRSWYVTSWVNADVDAIFDYRQDAVRTTEVGKGVDDEHRLRLFVQFGERDEWRALPTTVNAVSNSLRTEALALADGESLYLVACDAT